VATWPRPSRSNYWLEKDRKAEYPADWIRAFAQPAGWDVIPEEYGGSGLGVTEAR